MMAQEGKEDKGVFRQQNERVKFLQGANGSLIWNPTLSHCRRLWIFAAEVLPLKALGKGKLWERPAFS